MITLKRYLDGDRRFPAPDPGPSTDALLVPLLAAYGQAMSTVGDCTMQACPSVGDAMRQQLKSLSSQLSPSMPAQDLGEMDRIFQGQLQLWAQQASRYYRDKAEEVRELLLTMARTGELVIMRDKHCATHLNGVTERLREISSLDDVSQIRSAVKEGAAELKSAIERMEVEGRAAIEALRLEVKKYQVKLEQVEEIATTDSLTRLRNRMCIEKMIEARIEAKEHFSVCVIDIDDFKSVNDTFGHVVGDELLKMFTAKLRSGCRASDEIGRWGGDEFVLLLDCNLAEAQARVARIHRWVCGKYTLRDRNRHDHSIFVEASFGLADHKKNELMTDLVARADAAMYERKAESHAARNKAV